MQKSISIQLVLTEEQAEQYLYTLDNHEIVNQLDKIIFILEQVRRKDIKDLETAQVFILAESVDETDTGY